VTTSEVIEQLKREVAELRRDVADIRRGLRFHFKQADTPSRRQRYHPHFQDKLDWPSSDLK
jgi:hypothetical protein